MFNATFLAETTLMLWDATAGFLGKTWAVKSLANILATMLLG